MARVRLARADAKFILFTELYRRLEEPKAQRKAFAILEAAVSCYAKRGFHGVTLEMIAREAGVTRPLLRHYFKDLKEIQEIAIKYVRLLFQKAAVDGLAAGKTPAEMLARYVIGCFTWRETLRTHASVWLAFLQRCTLDRRMYELNTVAAETGADRIAHLLEAGNTCGEFNCANPAAAAKQIQAVIAGSLILSATEELSDPKGFVEQTRDLCLKIAGA